jgi:antitoxin VapB
MATKAQRPTPRRRQRGVTIRSDHALARLALLTRDGRSQAEVIEEALDRMPLPAMRDRDAFLADIAAILDKIPQGSVPTMAQFDAEFYDEHGLPR